MLRRLFVSIGALYTFLLCTAGAVTRTSTPHMFAHTEKEPTFMFYFPFPTENCPDECMYIAECATSRTHLQTIEDINKGNVPEGCFAPGNGNCECLHELDPEYCPIATYGECLMKCAGLRCSTPEHNGWDVYSPIPSDRYERMVEAYRKANDTSLYISNFRHIN